ncbi:LysR family transcriptional regulator [Bordetella sp. FB-8]|uniref:LysR family transcriptional regulator n=1 Tax=Bordetella sp. FB-8 TaxID=1159870 RepID=UPI00036AA4E6|nr:LysR family transcriptional regulator [Bordetella sp. FB-8]
MIRIDDLSLFIRSAALGSFSNAAREADLLPGQVSAAVLRLERELNVRLFARSTRSLRLTGEGERYLPYAEEVLSTLQAGQDRLHGNGGEPSGLLQVSAPSDLGRNVLLPWLTQFRRKHPALVLRLQFSDHVADVFRDPVDVAIRYGGLDDASYIALPLLPDLRRVLVASPDYLARHGRPKTLEDLASHSCLLYQLGGRIYDKWRFPLEGGRRVVAVQGKLHSDDGDTVRRWALAGEGIAYKSWLDVRDDLRAGRLQALLPKIPCDPTPLYFVCPHRKQFSPAVRQLYDALRDHCGQIIAESRDTVSSSGGRAARVRRRSA